MNETEIRKHIEELGGRRHIGAPSHVIDYRIPGVSRRIILYPGDVRRMTMPILQRHIEGLRTGKLIDLQVELINAMRERGFKEEPCTYPICPMVQWRNLNCKGCDMESRKRIRIEQEELKQRARGMSNE